MSTPATTLPIQDIAGEPLNDVQKRYLEGYFAGLLARGLKFSDVEPAPPNTTQAPAEDLIFEERVKRELHPLDAYP
jgi:ferredoxin-nitrite reductase